MGEFKRFKYELLIREHHLDTFGHVNNANYLALLEEARWELLSEQGIDLDFVQKTKVAPVMLDCHIKFLKEIRVRQLICIESQVLTFEDKVGVISQIILNEANELCSEAKMTFGVFDMKTRKLIPPPQKWLIAMGAKN